MARSRNWQTSLSDRTRNAYVKEGAKKGWSESQVRSYYENPSNNLGILRRHVTKSGAPVPEHGMKDVQRNPGKYGDYLKRNPPIKGGGPPPNRDTLKTDFISNIDNKLGHYFKYGDGKTVRANADRATIRELMLGANASEEQLRDFANDQRPGNPFWYHS